jgi:precorrin-6B methylase 2
MKLIALYKAYSGGEWFRQSLRSIKPVCDGVVVMLGDTPWLRSLPMPENCSAPLAAFRKEADLPVEVVGGSWQHQEDQYVEGLQVVHERFGEDAAALIIDTDEVWDVDELRRLRFAMEHSDRRYFRTHIYTYLKSPLYQVWPQERAMVTVGVKGSPEQIVGRFQANNLNPVDLPDLAFHHYPYVREHKQHILDKLINTGGQEELPSDASWVDYVWPALPFGENLHMTVGAERCWPRLRVLGMESMPEVLQDDPFTLQAIRNAESEWREYAQTCDPGEAVVPVPKQWELQAYSERLVRLGIQPKPIFDRIKNTILEQVVLADLAQTNLGVSGEGVIHEIGSGEGGSAAAFAEACPAARLYCIDPFELYEEQRENGKTILDVVNGTPEALADTAAKCHFVDRMTPVQKRSNAAADELPPADIVFVDGDHSYATVLDDLRRYWPKLKPGGLLIGHDFSTRFPGVIDAVVEWESEAGVTVHVHGGTSVFSVRKQGDA